MGGSDTNNDLDMIQTGMKNIDRNDQQRIMRYTTLLNNFTPKDMEEATMKQALKRQLAALQTSSGNFLTRRTSNSGGRRKSRKSRRNRRTKTKKNKSKSIFSFFM